MNAVPTPASSWRTALPLLLVVVAPLEGQQPATTVLTGEVRVRSEAARPVDADPWQNFTLLRTRVGVRADVNAGLGVLVQIQDSRASGEEASPTAGTANQLDLHQGYAEISGQPGGVDLSLRAGRQEIALGSQRLVGPSNGSNTARSFDAARPAVGPAMWFVVPPATDAPALLPTVMGQDDEGSDGADPEAIYSEFTRMEDAGPLSLGGTRTEVALGNERSVASAGWSSIGRAFEAGTLEVGPSGRPWWVAGVVAWVEAGTPRYPASHDELEEDEWFAGVAVGAPGAGAFVLVDRNAVVGPFTLVDRRVVGGRVRSSAHRTWAVFLDASHHVGEQRSSHGELGVEARMSTALAGVGFDTRTGSSTVPEVGFGVEYRTAAVVSDGEDVRGWPSPYTPLRRARGFAPGSPAVSGSVESPGEVTTLRFTVRAAAGGAGPVDLRLQHLIVPGDRGVQGLWEMDLAHPVTLAEAGRIVVGYTAYTRGSEGTTVRGAAGGMGHLVSVQWALEFQD